MEFIFGPIMSLLPFVIIGLVVYAIVQRKRRGAGEEAEVDSGIGTIRRLYFYVVSFVALMMAANGLVQVGRYLLEVLFGGEILSSSRTQLAIGASLLVVGLPIWAFHWRMVHRSLQEFPVERRSLVRKSYTYLVLGVAVGLAIGATVGALQWLFGDRSFSGYPWAALVVWLVVWAYHWRLESAEGQPTTETRAIRRLYLYLTSLATLGMVAFGLARVVHFILIEGYDSIITESVLVPTDAGLWRLAMRESLALAMVGSVAWGAHWLYLARRDFGSVLRQVYLFVSLLAGVVTVLVSLGFVLYGVLVWGMGVPDDETARAHFRFMPVALAALAAGLGLWGYHWSVVRDEAETSALESKGVRRSYVYALAAVGLGAVVVAVATLVITAIGILSESARDIHVSPDFWRNQIAVVVTLLILGGPLWGYRWASIQGRTNLQDADERASLVRRIFIFVALGAGALALLGSGSYLVFAFLRGLLESDLSLEVLREAKIAIGILATTALFLPYHWLVYRDDRRVEDESAGPERPPISRKEVMVLVTEAGQDFIRNLEAALGYRVDTLRWADPDATLPELSQAECEAVAAQIGDAGGRSVLLVPSETEVRVLSYD